MFIIDFIYIIYIFIFIYTQYSITERTKLSCSKSELKCYSNEILIERVEKSIGN